MAREAAGARDGRGPGALGRRPRGRARGVAEDPVAKLAKAKQMLDQGLISEAEYDALKAKILGAM